MFNKISNSINKTIAVIKCKTALFDFYLLYSFTSVRQFLINLRYWLFMKTSCYSCGFYGQLPLVCVGTLTQTCHLSCLQNKRRKQACLSTKVHTVCPQWSRTAIHISRAPEGERLAYL